MKHLTIKHHHITLAAAVAMLVLSAFNIGLILVMTPFAVVLHKMKRRYKDA